MRRTSQKWYNMQYINMSGKLPMGTAGNVPRVRYSAAYPTDAPAPQVRYSAAYPTDAPAPQASGCLSEANPKGRKGPRESVFSR